MVEEKDDFMEAARAGQYCLKDGLWLIFPM
jgi:hypothetical protein